MQIRTKIWQNNVKSPYAPRFPTITRPSNGPKSIHNASIASNKGGTPEAVLDNVTGKIINNINELENSIRELIINKKLREKLGINAKQRAENELSWKIISDKYLSIIKSLTN